MVSPDDEGCSHFGMGAGGALKKHGGLGAHHVVVRAVVAVCIGVIGVEGELDEDAGVLGRVGGADRKEEIAFATFGGVSVAS